MAPRGPHAVAGAARRLGLAAFLLAITSLFLPWWGVTHETDVWTGAESVAPFRPEPPLTTPWGPWATGLLVVVAALLLFLRLAGRSDHYEPAVWRRDLRVCAGLVLAACASALLWPADVPSFWGGRTYQVDNVTTVVTEVAAPGLGWWVAAVAGILLLVAWRVARPTTTK